MQELVDDIKLIRKTLMPESAALATINRLVDLVGEMESALKTCQREESLDSDYYDYWFEQDKVDEALTKSAPIAALARGK